MNMRPFQIVSLAIFGVLAVVGLYFFATYSGIQGSKSIGQITVWGTLPESAIRVSLEDLKRTHQEYAKVSYIERPADSFEADVADALASGTGPDVILISQEQLLAERSKLSIIPFSTIPERTFKDSYVSIAELFLTQGGTFGVPFVVDPLVLYYNRASLSRAGYAQAPYTWEEVLGATPSLTQKNGAVVTKSAIALGGYENITNARAIISLLLLQSGSTISESSATGVRGTLTKNTSVGGGVSPGQSAITFYTQFADPAKVVYTWNRSLPQARDSFIAGDTTLYIGYASEYALLKASNPNLDFDMAAIPTPQTASTRIDYARVYAFAIPKTAKNAPASYQVAAALSSQSSVALAAHALGVSPALRSMVSARTDDPNAAVYNPLTLIAKGWLSPAPGVTDRIFADMINNVISGRENVQEALKAADDSLGSAVAR